MKKTLFVIALFGSITPLVAQGQTWGDIATSAALVDGKACYTDGRDIICDSSAPTVNGTAASFEIPGSLKISDGSETCDAAHEGLIRYVTASKQTQFCNGTAWEGLATSSGVGSLAVDDLSNVNAPTPTDGQVLTWDNTAGEWQAKDAADTTSIVDADGNTMVQVEEGANDDTIRFDTAGVERMIIAADGLIDAKAMVNLLNATGDTGVGGEAASLAINDLSNVNTAPTDGQVLTWDNASGEWQAVDAASTVNAMDDLSDVNAAAPTDGQVLTWDNTASEWQAKDAADTTSIVDADGNTMVQVEEGANDDTIRFDTAGVERMIIAADGLIDAKDFVRFNTTTGDAGAGGEMPSNALNDLTNVNTAPTDGQVLTWDNASGEWQAANAASTVNAMDDLSDVNAAAPTDGQVLTWDNTAGEWQALDAADTTSIVDADGNTMVQVEEGANDDTIRFDTAGVERMIIAADGLIDAKDFVRFNNTTGDTGVGGESVSLAINDLTNVNTAPTDGQVLTWDNTAGEWQAADAGSVNAINDLTDGKSDGPSVFLGAGAGAADDGNNFNVGIGQLALNSNVDGTYNTAVGQESMFANTTGYENTALGWAALSTNTSGGLNTAVGYKAMWKNTSGSYNTAVGYLSGQNLAGASANSNVFLGYGAASNQTDGSTNIAIGLNAQLPNLTGSNQLNIGNTIYGDLATDKIGIGVTAPVTALDVAGTIMIGDGAEVCDATTEGAIRYTTAGGVEYCDASAWTGMGGGAVIADADGNTMIQVEETANDDTIRFDTAGTERMLISSTGLIDMKGLVKLNPTTGDTGLGGESASLALADLTDVTAAPTDGQVLTWDNTAGEWQAADAGSVNAINDLTDGSSDGSSVFLGSGAGAVDDGTDNQSTGVGVDALAANTTGWSNTAVGRLSLTANITGDGNTAVGRGSLATNTAGDGNTALGQSTLYNNTSGSNNVAIGFGSGFSLSGATASNNLFLGYNSSATQTDGSNNIAIGTEVDLPNLTGSNQLNIGDTIYGDLATDKIGIGVTAPVTALDVAGTIMIGDGAEVCDATTEGAIRYTTAGGVEYCDASAWGALGGSSASMADADGNTMIQVEETANDDTIRFDTAGTERLVIAADGLIDAKSLVKFNTTTGDTGVGGSSSAGALSDLTDVNATPTDGQVLTWDNTAGEWQAADAAGGGAINDLTDGASDGSSVFLGSGAGAVDDGTANANVAVGVDALLSNTSGGANIAIGSEALKLVTTQVGNVAIGHNALTNHVKSYSTAIGYHSLMSNTSGIDNVALGAYALDSNTSGDSNTALGSSALSAITTGNESTSVGFRALWKNTSSYNTAVGSKALIANTSGASNTALGQSALSSQTSGSHNISIGYQSAAGQTAGDYNIAIGSGVALLSTTGSNQLNIGNTIYGDLANDRIGVGVTTALTEALEVNGNAKATSFIVSSDRNLKENIKPLEGALDKVSKLKGVTYTFKDIEDRKFPEGEQVGLIAQEVEEVYPQLVNGEEGNKAVNYAALVSPLIEAVKELKAENEALRKRVEALEAQ